ncbi:conserved hypothetical protein [Cyanobium sp. PCC 7001]|uniref:Yae1 family protein n=1 Tax=Cyanobium sp. PCC 7001 TaxID=180281 RepID=UPI0001804B29|nr:Yae1 family protein [Cyanobium sp. PCC 7001]EDY38853.1 conserved hypothetical protein [Cyanobium sp. PCC 7001]
MFVLNTMGMIPIHSPSPLRRLAFPATAMALVMACSGTLPALAAVAQQTASPIPQQLLLAKDEDDNDKKKKKKNKEEKEQPRKKSDQNKKQQQNKNKDKNRNNNTDSIKRSTQQQRELNQKQKDRIYDRGVKDGKEKGYDKGVRSGYREGLNKGRDRGYQKGYNSGYRRGSDRWNDWDSNRWRSYNNRRNRNIWTRRTVVNSYYGNPGWARNNGWYNNRPWGGGWYGGWGSSSPPWGWWFGQSVVWGITTLATAAIINNAVDRAIQQRQPTVLVPQSNWQLYYGSVQPIEDSGVTFAVYNGGGTYQMQADCNEGLLNGEVPTSPAEAQLINAACQVTFGGQGQI